MFSHILLTRFNVRLDFLGRVAPDLDWLEHRFELFEKFAYPSVYRQTNQNFKWLVFFDVGTPDAFRERIASYARWRNFVPCYLDSLGLDASVNRQLAPFILEHINPAAKYLVTTRMDNDDAVSVDFIQQVQNQFQGQRFEFVNFPNGYLLRDNKLYRKRSHANPFISLVETAAGFKTVWCEAHSRLASVGAIRQVETKPLWLQVIHGKNVSNRVRHRHVRVPLSLLDEDFRLRHVYDADAERLWGLQLENKRKRIMLTAEKSKKAIRQIYDRSPAFVKRLAGRIRPQPPPATTLKGARVVWPKAGKASLKPFPVKLPQGDELLVLAQATLVSAGTERALFLGLPHTSVKYPYRRPGYSGAGVVIMVGANVTRFQVGDRVAAKFPHASVSLIKEQQAILIPGGVTMAQASFFRLGVIALQGVRKAGIQLGERVVVLGPGLIGQMCIQLAVAAGAYPVTAVASSGRRLPLAQQNGATHVIDLSQGRAALDHVRADVTIDASGAAAAIHDAVRCTRPGGRIILLGSNRSVTQAVDFAQIWQKEITLIGAHITSLPRRDPAPGAWPEVKEGEVILKMLAGGRLNFDSLLTDEILPTEVERLYRRLAQNDPSLLGAIFRWDWLPEAERLVVSGPEAATASITQAVQAGAVVSDATRRPASITMATPRNRESEQKMSETMRVGLIGCGEAGLKNAKGVAAATNATLAMAMDVDEQVAADMAGQYQIPYATDVEALLGREDIDAVVIATPHYLHAPLAIQAARCGKHVIVEKPMATSLADAGRMVAACRKAGVHLSVLYCYRYFDSVKKIKALLDQGALGQLLGLNLVYYTDKPVTYWSGGRTGRVATDWRLSWETSGGGILAFNLVHYLDMIRHLTGLEVTRVFSEFGAFDTPAETEDTISATLRFDNGLIGNVTAASCVRGTAPTRQELHIWGTEGQATVGRNNRFYSLRQVDDYKPGQWHDLDRWKWGSERAGFMQDLAAAVLGDREPPVNGQDGRAVQAIVEAVYASNGERPVNVER